MTNPRPPRRHIITKEEAQSYLRRRPTALTERGGFFPRDVIDQLLAQQGCAGVRFYFGTKSDGSLALVLVGVDANEVDMTDGVILEDHYPCPPFCDATSTLIR
jgi:hypothetical protein